MATLNTGSNKMVTRLRTRRNLETAMDTIKKRLKPDKKGSRKKNKPRIIVKKELPKKIQRPSLDVVEDVEFLPNKLKRTVDTKKIILKPKNKLKVVVAVNKRKRCTPHKGLQSFTQDYTTNIQTESDIQKQAVDQKQNIIKQKQKGIDQKQKVINQKQKVINQKQKVINQKQKDIDQKPFRKRVSVKDEDFGSQGLTMDELIRMNEENLTDDALLEILTCPSPVWWEDPPDIDTDALIPIVIDKPKKDTHCKNQMRKQNNENSHSNNIGINQNNLKRSSSVSDMKKAKKKAKLENILGYIKSRVVTDKTNNDEIENNDVDNINNDEYFNVNNDNSNSLVNNDDYTTQRTISTSGSEISLNEEDLLRSLQSIEIPIQKLDGESFSTKCDKNKTKHVNNKDMNVQSSEDHDTKHTKNENSKENKQNNTSESKKSMELRNKNHTRPENSKEKQQNNTSESKKSVELRNKELLKRLHKENNDILDVRLIKSPTNATNEVTVWSTVGDFKALEPNLKNMNEVIDIEDELEFSMIESDKNDLNNDKVGKHDPILIDDDSKDGDVIYLDDNLSAESEVIAKISHTSESSHKNDKNNPIDTDTVDVMYLDDNLLDGGDIESKVSDGKIANEQEPSQKSDSIKKDINAVNEKDIIKEDTIRMCNLDVRLIETSSLKSVFNDGSVIISDMNKKTENKSEIFDNTDDIKLNTNKDIGVVQAIQSNNLKYIQQTEIKSSESKVTKKESSDLESVNDTVSVTNTFVSDDTIKSENKNTEHKNNVEVTAVPQILTTLSRNLIKNTLDSPKSVKSLTESIVSEGTISDTNIQFIDEYVKSDEDNRSMEEEYLDDDFGKQNENDNEILEDFHEDDKRHINQEDMSIEKKHIKEAKNDLVTVYQIVDKKTEVELKNDENDKNTNDINDANDNENDINSNND